MKCGIENDSPHTTTQHHHLHAPYGASLASTASSSSSSIWSNASSQNSEDTSISTNSSQSVACHSYSAPKPVESSERPIFFISPVSKSEQPSCDALPVHLRQNPRRTSTGSVTRSGCPPALVRQDDRKHNFVDALVDSAALLIEAIWPLSSVVCRDETGAKAILTLRKFIGETLKRSRTSFSTLQVALYYLILIKPHVPKVDFTKEQPYDCADSRALQCGRRMFLVALILASKYLQDRNYAARTWSRMSGLHTQEINQNEMAFLQAVNWKLHITDRVFERWADIFLRYRPPPPPPGGLSRQYTQACADWQRVVLSLNPELDNIELTPATPSSAKSPRSTLRFHMENSLYGCESRDSTGLPKSLPAPLVLEPQPTLTSTYTPGRLAPILGYLPTPTMTPQSCGLSTPAVSAVPQLLGRSAAMGLAMAQACTATTSQYLDRWPSSTKSSPMAYLPTRRSSLAHSSTASSPESMISDVSRSSRSSSISSASSLLSATTNPRLGTQSRFRGAKLCNERTMLRPIITSVPEDYEDQCLTSSPESYTGPTNKLEELSLDTPLGRREDELELMARESANAARALQDLQHYQCPSEASTPTAKAGLKRNRTSSVDNPLQQDVREMLGGMRHSNAESGWPEQLVRSRPIVLPDVRLRLPAPCGLEGASKRRRFEAEALPSLESGFLHPGMYGGGAPGMWEGILRG